MLPCLHRGSAWVLLPFVVMGLVLSCDVQTGIEGFLPSAGAGPLTSEARPLDVPLGYAGPIDPQWPPSRPQEIDVELSSHRLLAERLRDAHAFKPQGGPLITVDTSNIYAAEGRIGGFDYIEVVLGARLEFEEALPLVVLLHGRGGRPTIPPGPYLSERPLRLFIPRGPDGLNGGYNWLATWTNSGKTELLSRSLAGQVDNLVPAIVAFSQLKKTLGKPMVVGFSQGGILAFGMAIRHPSRFSAVFPIAAWLPPGLLPKTRVRDRDYPAIHALHGGRDKVVPTNRGRATVRSLRKLGFEIEYTEVDGVGHTVTPEMNRLVRSWVREQSVQLAVSSTLTGIGRDDE